MHRSASTSTSTPLRRGAAAVAVAGGAFALLGGATPALTPDPVIEPAPDVVPVSQAEAALGGPLGAAPAPATQPVAPDPTVADAEELVNAVQLAEQEVARQAAERAELEEAMLEQAAHEQAARERAGQEQAGQGQVGQVLAVAEVRAAAASGSAACDVDTGALGGVKSHVRSAAEQLGCRFGEPDMHGVAGRSGTSDHPSGHAVDFMVDRATGDALASCALANMDALGIKYVIWKQQINHGNGWKRMEDRGSDTANHFDHVHISFERGGGGGFVQGC